jgi:hypothetical protein
MTEKKDRERVIAEITLSHLIRLGNEQGCPLSRQQALAFLNHEGRAFEMWKRMMQAAEEFVAGSLLQHSVSSEHNDSLVSLDGYHVERILSRASLSDSRLVSVCSSAAGVADPRRNPSDVRGPTSQQVGLSPD